MKPRSATDTPEIGPNALDQPQEDTVSLRLTFAQAEKAGLLDWWKSAINQRFKKIARAAARKSELMQLVHAMQQLIVDRGWTERKFEKETGLKRTSWRRIRLGLVPHHSAIKKLRSALSRL